MSATGTATARAHRARSVPLPWTGPRTRRPAGAYVKGGRVARPSGIPGERWHTVPQAAELLHMGEEFVRDRIRDGSLPAKKITPAGRGKYLVSDSAIAMFMASRPDAVHEPT